MRDFLASWFAGNPLLWGPVVALVLFTVIFALAAFRVWSRGARAYDDSACLPLGDEHE